MWDGTLFYLSVHLTPPTAMRAGRAGTADEEAASQGKLYGYLFLVDFTF